MRVFFLTACLVFALQGGIVDRLVIAVGHEAITELQLDEELRVTAFLNHQPVARDLESRRAAADRLIEQFLIRHEIALSRYPQPEPQDIAAYLDSVRAEQGGRAAFENALREYNLTESSLNQHLAQQLSTMRFVDYRFAPDTAVPDAEIDAAYRHEMGNLKPAHPENLPPAADVKERIRQKLAAERTDAALESWLAERRKQLTIVYLDKTLE